MTESELKSMTVLTGQSLDPDERTPSQIPNWMADRQIEVDAVSAAGIEMLRDFEEWLLAEGCLRYGFRT